MKKIWYYLLIMFIVLTIGEVKADGLEYYLSTNNLNYNYYSNDANKIENIKRGDYIYVTAMINNSSNISNYMLEKGKLILRWDEKVLELVDFDDGKNYNIKNSDYSTINVGDVKKTNNRLTIPNFTTTSIIQNGKSKLIEFKFHVLDNANAGLTKIYEMDGDGEIYCLNENESYRCGESYRTDLQFNIQKSSVNKLSNIKIDNVLIEGFNENINNYNFSVDGSITKINIEVTKKDALSSISGEYGTKNLDYGVNTFKIDVTSESGAVNTYTLNINRVDTRSKINTLKSIKLSSGVITFKPEITEYTVNVLNEVTKIKIESTLTDNKSKYIKDYGNREAELIEGSNTFYIKVISESGLENTYTLNIIRALSSNNTLKELYVNDDKIKLSNDTYSYTYTVENDITNVTIRASAKDEKAYIKIEGESDLSVGDNDIGIYVTAPNGDVVRYSLNVIREKIVSSNSELDDIRIENYDLHFSKDQKYYSLKIKDENKLNITPVLEDDKSTFNIEGNNNLINGSIIKINVIAEDNSNTRYFITIEKNTSGSNIVIIIIVLLLLLLAGIITVVLLKIKRKKEKGTILSDDEEKTVINEQKNENINYEENNSSDETIQKNDSE